MFDPGQPVRAQVLVVDLRESLLDDLAVQAFFCFVIKELKKGEAEESELGKQAQLCETSTNSG